MEQLRALLHQRHAFFYKYAYDSFYADDIILTVSTADVSCEQKKTSYRVQLHLVLSP